MGEGMRAWLALVGLVSVLAAGSARADDDGPNAEMLRDLRESQAERQQAETVPSSDEAPTLEGYLAKGDAQRAKGDHPRALWSYLLAHRHDLKDPRPIGRIGTLHLSREPERAEVIFRQLLEQGDDSALARTGLGLALIARGAWSEAVVELRRAVDDDGGLAATHNALGVALDHQKQAEAARWHYRRAAEIQPRSHEPWNNLGVSLLNTGEYSAAAEALEEAGRLEPRDAAVWNNLGVARGRLRHYDAALTAFRKAGDELSAQNNLGYLHYLNGDYDGALLAYEAALHAAGKPEERLPVLRNARVAQQAKSRPAARPRPAPAPAPLSGADAPGLGTEPGLMVEDVAPPAAPAEDPIETSATPEQELEAVAELPALEVVPPAEAALSAPAATEAPAELLVAVPLAEVETAEAAPAPAASDAAAPATSDPGAPALLAPAEAASVAEEPLPPVLETAVEVVLPAAPAEAPALVESAPAP
jgi:Flp pilus assembly protein TadD